MSYVTQSSPGDAFFPHVNTFRSLCVIIVRQDTAVICKDDYLLLSFSFPTCRRNPEGSVVVKPEEIPSPISECVSPPLGVGGRWGYLF